MAAVVAYSAFKKKQRELRRRKLWEGLSRVSGNTYRIVKDPADVKVPSLTASLRIVVRNGIRVTDVTCSECS